ncbi:MAG: hypothetical protein LBF42_02455 [Puniceicoccales bacterium]|nr:hypothetical protein [Puniceicoccales bacterium]
MRNLVKAFLARRARFRCREFLKKHDIFRLSAEEYTKDCRIFEQNFAGIVLGRCLDGVEVKIIQVDSLDDMGNAAPLSLGYFGEIVYRRNGIWQGTGFYGFIDHRSRVWCCGKIEDSLLYNGEYFFPYCIEPVFETLFFVKHTKLTRDENGAPSLIVTPHTPFKLPFLRKPLIKILRSFAKRFEKTKNLSLIKIEGFNEIE